MLTVQDKVYNCGYFSIPSLDCLTKTVSQAALSIFQLPFWALRESWLYVNRRLFQIVESLKNSLMSLDHSTPAPQSQPIAAPTPPPAWIQPQARTDDRQITNPESIKQKLGKELSDAALQMEKEYIRKGVTFRRANLKKLNLEQGIFYKPDPKLQAGAWSFQGRRASMEDQHIMGTCAGFPIFAVLDGHGGDLAAKHVEKNLVAILEKNLETFAAYPQDVQVWNALKITCAELHNSFNTRSGTTAVIAFIYKDDLYVANVGDSRAVLATPDRCIQLTEDAKPDDLKYKKSIIKRKGWVNKNRVGGKLAVARAIGDHNIQGINPRPKITKIPKKEIPPGSHLVLACDGIFDVARSEDVANLVRCHSSEPAHLLAARIGQTAFTDYFCEDNLTIVVHKIS